MSQALDLIRRWGVSKLAKSLGVTPSAISQWRHVPPDRVLAVEAVTGIPRDVLRPDLYVAPPDVPRPPADLPVTTTEAAP